MNRRQKIELLQGIKTGKVSIREIKPPTHKVFFIKGDIYTDKDTGKQYTKDTLPKANIIHLIKFKDCR